MQIIDLFAGIGCWSYAGHMMGWDTVQMVEINPFCQKVLSYHFPKAAIHDDIKTFGIETLKKSRWDPSAGTIICGSAPCQPFSDAGKKGGTADPRHLWPEMFRAIREIKPPWVCYENVPGMLTTENGVVFKTVCTDLESEGYEVTPFNIPACGAGAIHIRKRLWIVAYCQGNHERNARLSKGGLQEPVRGRSSNGTFANTESRQRHEANETIPFSTERNTRKEFSRYNRNAPNANSYGHGHLNGLGKDTTAPGAMQEEQKERQRLRFIIGGSSSNESWIEAATRLCGVDDGNAGRLDVTAISKPKWRIESLKAYGNAIYWPIAFNIFQAIAASHPQ